MQLTVTARKTGRPSADSDLGALVLHLREQGRERRLTIEFEDLEAMSVLLRLHPLAYTAFTLNVTSAVGQSQPGSTIHVGGIAGNGELLLSSAGVLDASRVDEGRETYVKLCCLPIPGARKTKGYVEVAPGKFEWRTGPKDDRYKSADVLKIVSRHVEDVCVRRGEIIGRTLNETDGRSLTSELSAHPLDTYAIARACFDWSGDYLSAWLKQHGLPSAHSVIRRQRVAIARRLLAGGVSENSAALQVGVRSRTYLRQLLAQDAVSGDQ